MKECFNCPYGTQYFADYAEPIPGETSNNLSKIAKDLQVYIIGGSIPEIRGDEIYNTTAVFGPDGTLIGTYSKVMICIECVHMLSSYYFFRLYQLLLSTFLLL